MKLIGLLTNTSAFLSVGALPLWILGIPGVDGPYARGWKLGLSVLFCYPLFVLALRCGSWATSRFSKTNPEQLAQWTNGIGLVGWIVGAGLLVQSFRIMSQKD